MFLLVGVLLCVFQVNAEVQWNTLEYAVSTAKDKQVPIMFVMTKGTCKPCTKLYAELDKSLEFAELGKNFILAKANDDLPTDPKFDLDGKYVPKIVFLNHFGQLYKEVVNADAKSERAKYFYSKVEHVLKSMNKTMELFNLDNGFGKDYNWYTWESGSDVARQEDKPILIVFHQDWCGACARLKPKFAGSSEIKELADKFVMINTDDEKLVKSEKYKADGEYYPKILFLDSNGELLADEWNHGTVHSHVTHYYGDGAELSLSMKRVIGNTTIVEKVDDKGFGAHIRWVKYEDGLKLVKEKSKPMMLIIHKSYCGACKAMKPRIRNDATIAELSKKFVMVHCEDDEEPLDDQFDIDGAYIPRIFFLDNKGRVDPTIKCDESDFKDTTYAYGTAASIIRSMQKALDMNLGSRHVEGGQTTAAKTEETTQQQVQQEEPLRFDGYDDYEDPGFPKVRFNEEFKWFDYEEGLREAKKSHKIGMLVFYNDYCQFSAFLIKQLQEHQAVREMINKFVLIKVVEEMLAHIEDKDKFNIDGTYTPKILFMDPDQNLYPDINNTETAYPNTLYYYGDGESIANAMRIATAKINLTLGNGFGEYIDWVKFEKSFELANETNKPIMMIIHKTWCGACNALKPIVEFSRPIWELTAHFIMVNVEDDAEPLDNQYFVDGGYYPRIFFINPKGIVDKTLHNRDPAYLKHKYSYGNEEHIMMTMKFAAHKYSKYAYRTAGSQEYQSQEQQQQQQQQQPHQQTQEAQKTQETQNAADSTSTDTSGLTAGKKLLAASGANFMNINDALPLSSSSKKPIMFLIHRTTCPSCKALMKSISRDREFKTKTSEFILSDIEDDIDEKQADSYDVDGGYVPRIYFLDPEGNIIRDIWNIGTNYMTSKFYYYDMNSIYRGMERATKHMETWQPGQNKVVETPKKEEETPKKEEETTKKEEEKEKKEEL